MSKNNSPEKCWVVIPAAGTGERFDQKVAKQALKISEKLDPQIKANAAKLREMKKEGTDLGKKNKDKILRKSKDGTRESN